MLGVSIGIYGLLAYHPPVHTVILNIVPFTVLAPVDPC